MTKIVHNTASLPDYALPLGANFAMVLSIDENYDLDGKTVIFRLLPAKGATGFEVSSADVAGPLSVTGQAIAVNASPASVGTLNTPTSLEAVAKRGPCRYAFDIIESGRMRFRVQGNLEWIPVAGGFDGDGVALPTVTVSVAPDETISVAIFGGDMDGGGADITNETVNAAIANDAGASRTALGLGDAATKNVGTTAGTVAAGDASPNAHASSHASAGGDAITPADIGAATAAQGSLAATAVQPNTSPTFSGATIGPAVFPLLANQAIDVGKDGQNNHSGVLVWNFGTVRTILSPYGVRLSSTNSIDWSSTSTAGAHDTRLLRDGGGILAQKSDGPQTLRIYGNTSSGYAQIAHDGTKATVSSSLGGLDIQGMRLQELTVATLPTASTNARARYEVTDADSPTVGATVVTGGSVQCTVRSNGTNWIVLEIL
jgi:hypothetical protein